MEESPSRVKNATDHHAQLFFFTVMAVADKQSSAQKSPSSAIDPRDRRNHIISAVTQTHCQGVLETAHISSGVMLETQNTSDASSQPAARTKLQF